MKSKEKKDSIGGHIWPGTQEAIARHKQTDMSNEIISTTVKVPSDMNRWYMREYGRPLGEKLKIYFLPAVQKEPIQGKSTREAPPMGRVLITSDYLWHEIPNQFLPRGNGDRRQLMNWQKEIRRMLTEKELFIEYALSRTA